MCCSAGVSNPKVSVVISDDSDDNDNVEDGCDVNNSVSKDGTDNKDVDDDVDMNQGSESFDVGADNSSGKPHSTKPSSDDGVDRSAFTPASPTWPVPGILCYCALVTV